MRFCPFCAKENSDEADHCSHCGKRLPPRRRTGSSVPVATAPAAPSAPVSPSPGAAPPHLPPRPPVAPRPTPGHAKTLFGVGASAPTAAARATAKPAPTDDVDEEAATRQLNAADPRIAAAIADPAKTLAMEGPPSMMEPAPSTRTPAAVPVETGTAPVSVSQLISVDVAQPLDLQALSPMPSAPPPGLLGPALYLLPVIRGQLARRAAKIKVRQVLADDQAALDQALGDLGRALREEELELPALRDELGHLKAQEERRSRAESDAKSTIEKRAAEEKRFGELEAEAHRNVAAQEEVVQAADTKVREQTELRKTELGEATRLERSIQSLTRKADGFEAKAAKSPPGDPNRTAAEAGARALRSQITELVTQKEAAAAKVATFDEPLAKATKDLEEGRIELGHRQHALATLLAERKQTLEGLDAELVRLEGERSQAASEISGRFVSLGTLLNLNRVELPRFSPIYARIDDLKTNLTEREALIERLDSERTSFDRRAFNIGLAMVGGTGAAVIVIIVVLILAL